MRFYSVKAGTRTASNKHEFPPKFKMASKADDSKIRLLSGLLEGPWCDGKPMVPRDLDDCIRLALRSNRPRLKAKNDIALKTAATFTNELIANVMTSNELWRRYIVVPGRFGKTATLQKNDLGSFVCHVQLKRPTRPSAFVFQGDRLPSMHCKVKVNPRLSREQQTSVVQEWVGCASREGTLRPDVILRWFNRGLLEGKRTIAQTSSRWTISHLVSASGAIVMAVTGSPNKDQSLQSENTSQHEPITFSVTFVPCIDWVKVPDSKTTLPTSQNGPFPEIKRALGRMSKKVKKKDGSPITLLAFNPKFKDSEPEWKLCMSKYDREIMKLIEGPDFPPFTSDIVVLIETMVLYGTLPLFALTKEVLLQALLNTLSKHQYEPQTRPELFLNLLEYLKSSLSGRYLRHFFIPSINVLKEMDNYEVERSSQGLEVILKELRTNAEMLLVHCGLRSRFQRLSGKLGYQTS